METYWPAELPAGVTCSNCGDTYTVPTSWRDLYDENGEWEGPLKRDSVTSKRKRDVYRCPCGRRLATVLDPHWPGGASGGYVEDPPEERTG